MIEFIELLVSFLLLRRLRARKACNRIATCLESEFTTDLLELILSGMGLVLLLSKDFRQNIIGFTGRYVFASADGSFLVSAEFANERLHVHKGRIADPNIDITFQNAGALASFLFSPKPDILGAVLNQSVTLEGNLNYLYKFGYMANHLRLKGLELLSC